MSRITAIICTFNRANLLLDTLESLACQTLPKDQYEILVVDNASTDATREVVLAFKRRAPVMVRYFLEEEKGVARARNRGWQEAQTELVAYIDDDARAEPQWLESYINAFSTVTPSPPCMTGRVDLDWIGGRPAWFPSRLESLLARYDFGSTPCWLSNNAYLVTCNVAFTKQILAQVGGFRVDLGNCGNQSYWQGGEDTEMFFRLVKKGLGVYYEPRALVYHLTPPERQTKRYLLWRLYANGSSQVVANNFENAPSRSRMLRGAWGDCKALVRSGAELMIATLAGKTVSKENALFECFRYAGRLRMDLRMAGIWK